MKTGFRKAEVTSSIEGIKRYVSVILCKNNAFTSGNYTKNVIKNRAKVKNNAELLVPCFNLWRYEIPKT